MEKRCQVPQITDLNLDTWTQRGGAEGGSAKCYLTFNVDFKWCAT